MNPSIKIIPFPEIENSYIVISSRKDDNTGNGVSLVTSFLYADEISGAEWEPDNGPIKIIEPCGATHENAAPHWFYPYYKDVWNWSQLAVDAEKLPQHLLDGSYSKIFAVLKKWAEND